MVQGTQGQSRFLSELVSHLRKPRTDEGKLREGCYLEGTGLSFSRGNGKLGGRVSMMGRVGTERSISEGKATQGMFYLKSCCVQCSIQECGDNIGEVLLFLSGLCSVPQEQAAGGLQVGDGGGGRYRSVNWLSWTLGSVGKHLVHIPSFLRRDFLVH